MNIDEDQVESSSSDLVLSNDNVGFLPEPTSYSKFPAEMHITTMRENIHLKLGQHKRPKLKPPNAFRNLMWKSPDQPDNSNQNVCVTTEDLSTSGRSQKLSTIGTSSSSESSPSSTSLRKRISNLENFKPKFLMPSMLNRRWGTTKNGK